MVCSESRPKWFKQPMITHLLPEASALSGRGEDGDLGKTEMSVSKNPREGGREALKGWQTRRK